MFTLLKPFAGREGPEHGLRGILAAIPGQRFGISSGFVIPFAPPSIQGLGNFGGFTMEVLDQSGGANVSNLGGALQSLIAASQKSTQVAGLFSPFTASDPQLAVDIDREKAR